MSITECISFDDVLIKPAPFSNIRSRKDVTVVTEFLGVAYGLPIVSSNMTSVTGVELAKAMGEGGAGACLPRFNTIEENVAMFKAVYDGAGSYAPWVSVGAGIEDIARAKALVEVGAKILVVDVANGAAIHVVEQIKRLHETFQKQGVKLVVGNFATSEQIKTFKTLVGDGVVHAYKVGVGNGGSCTTRLQTGVGVPLLTSIADCVSTGELIIADGGIKNAGDFCKALAAGASFVMSGRMFVGTKESAAPEEDGNSVDRVFKRYSGSASKVSYEQQGKLQEYITHEGDSYLVPVSGTVQDVLRDLEGGLRSSMSYTNSADLTEYRKNAKLIRISVMSQRESGAHGRHS